MLLTMIGAFANFFSIINSNTAASETYSREVIENVPKDELAKMDDEEREYQYVANLVGMGNTIIDAYLEMYLLALGEFDFEGF